VQIEQAGNSDQSIMSGSDTPPKYVKCLLIKPAMTSRNEVEVVELKYGSGFKELSVDALLGNDAWCDHFVLDYKNPSVPFKCVTVFWNNDPVKVQMVNKVAMDMVKEIVANVSRIEPLTDCRTGNVVICITDQNMGKKEETGSWVGDMQGGDDAIENLIGHIRAGINKSWFSIPDSRFE